METGGVMSEEVWFRHEKLDVTQESIEYYLAVRRCTARFPPVERFELTSQLNRAALPVSSNIAEGIGRATPRDRIRFLDMANGSLLESVTQLTIAARLGYVCDEDHQSLRRMADALCRQLAGIRRHYQSQT